MHLMKQILDPNFLQCQSLGVERARQPFIMLVFTFITKGQEQRRIKPNGEGGAKTELPNVYDSADPAKANS